MSSSTMMVWRLQGSLHGPSPLKTDSIATWRCWMTSHSNTWPKTAAPSRTSCSGSKRYCRLDPDLQKDVNEHKLICLPKLAHSYTYVCTYCTVLQDINTYIYLVGSCTYTYTVCVHYVLSSDRKLCDAHMSVICLMLLHHPLNESHTNNMPVMSPLPGFYFGIIIRPHTVNFHDLEFDFSCCFVY